MRPLQARVLLSEVLEVCGGHAVELEEVLTALHSCMGSAWGQHKP